MKAVMYHYVRFGSENFPYFRYLHFHNFCRQLDHFEKIYGFVSKEDFLESVEKRENLTGRGVILTFDDGIIPIFDEGIYFWNCKACNTFDECDFSYENKTIIKLIL